MPRGKAGCVVAVPTCGRAEGEKMQRAHCFTLELVWFSPRAVIRGQWVGGSGTGVGWQGGHRGSQRLGSPEWADFLTRDFRDSGVDGGGREMLV